MPDLKDKISLEGSDDVAVQKIMGEIRAQEEAIELNLAGSSEKIDEKIRGEAAVTQQLVIEQLNSEKLLLSPEHLRYLARQLRLLMILKQNIIGIEDEGEKD